MTLKTILLTTAFVGGSVLAATAQTGSGTGGAATGATNVSPATHCIDRATNQPRLKSAASGQSGSGTTGAASGGAGGPGTGSSSGAMSGSSGSSSSSGMGSSSSGAGVSSADLQPC